MIKNKIFITILFIGAFAAPLMVTSFLKKRLEIDFTGLPGGGDGYVIAAITATPNNLRLMELVDQGIDSQFVFDEFNFLRTAAVIEAQMVESVEGSGKEAVSLSIPRESELIIVFDYDKTGVWTFEIWDLREGLRSINVGLKPKMDLRKYFTMGNCCPSR